MRCRNCGREIPNGKLHCEYCGKEVRIVPDYNPLDDVLAAQVKGAIDGTQSPLDDYEYRTDRSLDKVALTRSKKQDTHSGKKRPDARQGTRRQDTRPGARRPDTRPEARTNPAHSRKQSERKRALKKKRRNRMLLIMGIIFTAMIGIAVVIYQNSYSGQVKKGYKAIAERDYTTAEVYFEKAIAKKPKKADAYTGLTEVYMSQNKKDQAIAVFEEAVENNHNNVEIYEACIQFYLEIKENNKIPVLLDNASDKVRNSLKDYIVDKPKFSLDDNQTYDDVQQLTLESKYEIRYTTDGSDPTVNSSKYTEPIQIPEEETVVKAIAVNENGIPSLIVTKTYKVELPMEDAPAVSPSTGQYEEMVQITIIVPEGYTAYYTMDRSDPDENATMYTGPIDMPEGSTIFKAVLVNSKGKLSGITTRNYELTITKAE